MNIPEKPFGRIATNPPLDSTTPMSVVEVFAGIKARGGFLTEGDLAVLGQSPQYRLTLILVRCGGGRFLASACQVEHFMRIITTEGSDYIRDLSLPVNVNVTSV